MWNRGKFLRENYLCSLLKNTYYTRMRHPWIAAIIIATIFIVFRIITANHDHLANCSPLIAILFCGAAFWKSNRWLLPTAFGIWLISNPIVSSIQGYPTFNAETLVALCSFGLVVAIGFKFQAQSAFKLIFGTILGSIAFYLITNTASFLSDPVYAKTLDGYSQCMWTGSPAPTHSTPSWIFFRNSLVANTLGTCLFLSALSLPQIQKLTQFKLARQTA
jgi:hypothetical protein